MRRKNLGNLAQKFVGKDANLRALARKFQVSGVPPQADRVSVKAGIKIEGYYTKALGLRLEVGGGKIKKD